MDGPLDLSILMDAAEIDINRESVAGDANPAPVIQLPTPQMRQKRLDQSRSRGSTPVSGTRSLGGTSPITNIDDLIPAGILNDQDQQETSVTISGQFGNFSSSLADRDNFRKKIDRGPGFGHRDWMNKIEDMAGPVLNDLPLISPKELATHKSPGDYWIAIGGNVYDITDYLNYHPGGASILMERMGTDATEDFQLTHSFVNYSLLLAKHQVAYLLK